MSRIGKLPIEIPEGAEVNVDGQTVTAKGSNGTQAITLSDLVRPSLEEGQLRVMPREDHVEAAEKRIEQVRAKGKKLPTFAEALHPDARMQWGTSRARLANMVYGVTHGFSKTLEIQGVGYRAQMQGNAIKLSLGFSHDVVFTPPEGIKIATPKPTEVVVSGFDKQVVGQVAAKIRAYRTPEPYKGKGVRYQGEYVRTKEGKKK
jgi:large subunit ribosomal protein L6